ncbi:MAG: TetR/AcrR family transcriptional regulator [Eubacterium sp.]|nr:TetR/AcrR family transcriptional regulator [Eubacterium sp.]
MRKNTREDILTMARKLFSEGDYNSVSVKNIADALGISTGNLTYHFKKKEDIALALVQEQYNIYQSLDPVQNLTELRDYLRHLVDVQKKHAYYFKHYAQFSQISPAIKQMQDKIYQNISEILTVSFQNLHEKGVFIEDQYPHQHKRIIDTLMILCTHSYTNEDVNLFDCMWNAILPLLSEEGKNDYKALE